MGCGGVMKFGRSVLMDGNNDDPQYNARAWKTTNIGCVPNQLCQRYASGAGGCNYADYVWRRYYPTSCNASATPPYDAEFYRQRVRAYYKCCNTDNCINPANAVGLRERDLNATCTKNEALGTYISKLFQCWNTERRTAFRKYFLCGDGFALKEYRDECRDAEYGEFSGALARNTTRCRYRPTCTAKVREFIESFGECACGVAAEAGYFIGGITKFVENLWERYCPNLELSCSMRNASRLILRRRRRRRIIKFVMKKARDYFTDAVKTEIRKKIATYLRRQDSEEDIVITVGDVPTSRRMLLEDASQVSVNVYSDEEAYDESIASDACDAAGLTTALGEDASDVTCDSEVTDDTLVGDDGSTPSTTEEEEDDDSMAAGIKFVFGLVLGLIACFMQ